MYYNAYFQRGKEFKDSTIFVWDDKRGLQTYKYKPYAYKKTDGVTDLYSIYGDPVKRVFKWKKKDEEDGNMFETDVPVLMRFLIDEYHESDDVPVGHRDLFFDIEVSSEGGFPNPLEAESEIQSIAWYDKIANSFGVFVLDVKMTYDNFTTENGAEVKFFETEEDLLTAFVAKWSEIAPTVVTGWNIDHFDIPYLFNRTAKVLGTSIAKTFSPISIVTWNEYKEQYHIAGVSCLDYLGLYKKFTFSQESSYSLDAIGTKEVKMGKVKYDGSLNNLFKTDIMKFIEYNLCDVIIVKLIDEKMKLLELAKSVAHKAHCTYDDVYFSSRVIEGAILTHLKRLNIVAPNKTYASMDEAEEAGEESFSGAFVKEPIPGRYKWIYDLDMTSLYPSVIMSLNISPETQVGKVENWDVNVHVSEEIATYYVTIGSNNPKKMTSDELRDYLEQHKFSIAANGVMYRTDKFGLIPSILDEWFKERVEYKNLMKKYGNAGDKVKYEYFKDRQAVQKVLLNSVYGTLGLQTFRFYNRNNAEAVTTTSVQLIKYVSKMENYYYAKETGKEKDYVIYLDTDSTFLSSEPIIRKRFPKLDYTNEELMIQHTREIAAEIMSFLNKSFDSFGKHFLNITKHRFDIKQEIIAKTAFWAAKKGYAYWIIDDNGVGVDKYEIKGLGSVRSNFPKSFRAIMKEILIDILKDTEKDVVDEKVLTFKRNLSPKNFREIAKPTGVKNIAQYTAKDIKRGIMAIDNKPLFKQPIKGAPVHVKAVINYNNLLMYYGLDKKFAPLYESEKIMWAYLKANPFSMDAIAFRGYDDPKEIVEFVETYIDVDKIYNHELWSKLQDIYNAMSWTYPSESAKLFNQWFS